MRLTRFIKIFLISLYMVFLGFVLFFNTSSVHAEIQRDKQDFVTSVTSGYDSYWVNLQDKFDDDVTRFNNKAGNSAWLSQWNTLSNQVNSFNYIVIPTLNVRQDMGLGWSSSDGDLRGYIVYIYNTSTTGGPLTSDTDFTYGTFNDYYGGFFDAMGTDYGENMSFNAVKIPGFARFGIYNYSQSYVYRTRQESDFTCYVPLSIYNYYHHVYYAYKDRANTSGATQIANAIQTQTNTLSNETQKQTNAITTATKEQTNALLDTNDTGNETMSVNDTTTDTSADLGGLFNQISGAFTDTSEETQKGFDLKLPNR